LIAPTLQRLLTFQVPYKILLLIKFYFKHMS
jgi:hypothetical protein